MTVLARLLSVFFFFFFGFWIHVRGREMGLCVVQSCAELGRVVEGVETVETVERMGVGEEVGKGVRVGRGSRRGSRRGRGMEIRLLK